MKAEYFNIPYGTIYLKVVAGSIFSVQRELIKTGVDNDDWKVVETETPLTPIIKNE